ncbi:mitochondrial group I intron splicing factor [Acrasis kona]|uniref:Mitochondrial group I intron splicing factor n=1 Tax=Acrasis kona TaxID=1008807 RepID=A0AAW2YP80_9EUKA
MPSTAQVHQTKGDVETLACIKLEQKKLMEKFLTIEIEEVSDGECSPVKSPLSQSNILTRCLFDRTACTDN